MSDTNVVVVSHRGWDGNRILGVFSSKDVAIEATKNFKLAENEELVLDIMKLGCVSVSCGSTHTGKSIIERHHSYT